MADVFRYYTGSAEGKPTQRHLYKLQLNGQKSDENEVECLSCTLPARPIEDVVHLKSMSHQSIYNREANLTSSHPRFFHVNSTCHYSSAVLSPNLDYYVHECRGPSIPYVAVRSLDDNQLVRVLQLNDHLKEEAMHKAYPRVIKLRVPLLMDNTPWSRSKPDYVSVELYLPPGLVEEETTVYPLIIWP